MNPWKNRLSCFLFLFLCSGLWAAETGRETYTPIENPAELPEFLLFDQDFKPLRRENLKGQWTLLYFGYMNCPDVCPTTLSTLARTMKQMRGKGGGNIEPQVLFISVDPWRDTPEKLKSYVHFFDESFRAASADTPLLNILTNFLKVIYFNDRSADETTDYAVSHSDAVFLINPEARFQGYFQPPLDADDMARTLNEVMSAPKTHGSLPPSR